MTSGQAIISIAVVFIGVDTVVLSADPRWCTETLIESPEGRRYDVVYYKPVLELGGSPSPIPRSGQRDGSRALSGGTGTVCGGYSPGVCTQR